MKKKIWNDPKEIVQQIIERLKAEGFTIQRYDAYSTSSMYLKLDYGVCNSIRIADHPGKTHLKYRYNVLLSTNCHKYFERKDNGHLRRYYPATMQDLMITQILEDKKRKQERFGEEMYETFMNMERNKHQDDKGFWSQAVLV